MKLSKRTRYGVRLMFELALNYNNGVMSLSEIAEKEDISMKYLSQIVIPLKNAGLIIADRGSKGGYILAKPPNMITIYDVVCTLEGETKPVECISVPSRCPRYILCPVNDVWHKLSDSITELLKSISFGDLLNDFAGKKKMAGFNYQI